MSYILEYPYTEEQLNDFIVEYNHNKGLRIETVDNFVEVEVETENIEDETLTETRTENHPTYYALEANEIIVNGEVIIDPEYEEKQKQKERERIAQLFLTGADVERGIYKAKGMDFEDIIAFVSANPPQGLDIKALKIELKANNFYRGNPYVSAIGALLGFTSEQLDQFFETNDYTVLLSKEEPIETPIEEPTEIPIEEPTETPTETPIEESTDVPVETPTEVPNEENNEAIL